MPPRLIQYTADLQPGDAVSDMVRLLASLADGWGWATRIVVGGAAQELRHQVTLVAELGKETLGETHDLHVYHFSGACPPLADAFLAGRGQRWLVYHSSTPPGWFTAYDPNTLWATGLAQLELERLRGSVHRALSYSSSNLEEMRAAGFAAPERMPVLIDARHFDTLPDSGLAARLADGTTHLLFVGRVAPNKCHEDIVRIFYHYRRGLNPRSRLHLVGSLGIRPYVERVRGLIDALGLADAVDLPGKVSAAELAAYYRGAHAFVCMSEHEGFCVPIVEAMHHRVPVLAYAAAAVPETLGSGGILARQKRFDVLAEALHLLISDTEVRAAALAAQDAQRASFALDAAASRLHEVFSPPTLTPRSPA